MCYIGVPTVKLIQAARTKEFLLAGIARLRLERKKERKPTRIHSEVVGTKNFTDRNYVKKRGQNQEK